MKCLWLPRMRQQQLESEHRRKIFHAEKPKIPYRILNLLDMHCVKKHRLKTKNIVDYCSNVLFYIKKQFIVKLRKKNQLRKCSTGTRRVYAMKLETIQWHSFSCFSMTWFCGALKIKWGGGEGWMVLWCKISNPSCGKQFSKIGGSYKNILFGVSWQPIFVERKHGIHLEGHEIKNRNQCIIHLTNFSRCHIIWGSS